MGFIALIFIAMGILNVIKPRTGWYLSIGWKFKNAEPSDLALGMQVLGGIIAIIIGIVLMFRSFI